MLYNWLVQIFTNELKLLCRPTYGAAIPTGIHLSLASIHGGVTLEITDV